MLLTAIVTVASLAACDPGGILGDGPYRPTGHHFVKEISTPRPEYTHDMRTAESLDASKLFVQCKNGPLKGCTKAQLQEYTQGAIKLVWNGFYATQTSAKPPFLHLFVQHGIKKGWNTKTSCTTVDGQTLPYDELIYAYCPADGTVYLGEDRMWQIYGYGYLAPILALAHEYVHRLQSLAGVTSLITPPDNWGTLTKTQKEEFLRPWSNLLENQADCGAGVWLHFAQDHGMVDPTQDPISQVVQFFVDLNRKAGRTTDPDHGTPELRRAQFLRGYNSKDGLVGCNDYHDNAGHSITPRPIMPVPAKPSTKPSTPAKALPDLRTTVRPSSEAYILAA
jgi:predicted metalloprotease